MLEKIITIDGKEVAFRTSAALPRIYREKFKSDVFIDLNRMREQAKKNKKGKTEVATPYEALDTVEQLAYCMAKHADSSVPDDINEWLAQFSTTAIYHIAREVMLMWNEEERTASMPKNQASR